MAEEQEDLAPSSGPTKKVVASPAPLRASYSLECGTTHATTVTWMNRYCSLKMRVLPAKFSCDTAELLEEVIASGMVVRTNGCLKIVNLADKQPLDLRFLVSRGTASTTSRPCYKKEDKKPSRGAGASVTRATPVVPSSAPRSGDWRW